MPLFSEPGDRPTPKGVARAVAASGGLLLGLLSWSMIAIGLAGNGPIWGIAVLGLIFSMFAKRAFFTTLILEIILLSAASAVFPPSRADWLFIGGGLWMCSRAAWIAARRMNSEA